MKNYETRRENEEIFLVEFVNHIEFLLLLFRLFSGSKETEFIASEQLKDILQTDLNIREMYPKFFAL